MQEHESGQHVSRGKVFVATHTKVDGSYVNNATKTICVSISCKDTLVC